MGENQRFYSGDPYEVLGIPRGSSKDDLDKAKKKLLRKYHPDVNKDAMASEISKLINAAYDRARDELKGPNAKSRTYTRQDTQRESYSHASNHHEPRQEKKQTAQEQESEFYRALRMGANFYKQYIVSAKKAGLTVEKITEFIRSSEGRKIFTDELFNKVRLYSDNPERVEQHILEWKDAGINISSFLKSGEVSKTLQKNALHKIRLYADNVGKFIEMNEGWKRLGINLDKVLNSDESKKILFDTIAHKVRLYEDPKKFLDLVNDWKRAGIDLSETVNLENVSRIILDLAKQKFRLYGKEKARQFVLSWVNAGWHASQEILEIISKATK